MPALIDLAAQLPAAKDGLAALLQQLIPTRAADPNVMNLVRAIVLSPASPAHSRRDCLQI